MRNDYERLPEADYTPHVGIARNSVSCSAMQYTSFEIKRGELITLPDEGTAYGWRHLAVDTFAVVGGSGLALACFGFGLSVCPTLGSQLTESLHETLTKRVRAWAEDCGLEARPHPHAHNTAGLFCFILSHPEHGKERFPESHCTVSFDPAELRADAFDACFEARMRNAVGALIDSYRESKCTVCTRCKLVIAVHHRLHQDRAVQTSVLEAA